LTFHIAQIAQALAEGLKKTRDSRVRLGSRDEKAYTWDARRVLCLAGQRHKCQADSENDREPDPPHRHLGEDGWRESSRRRLIAGGGRIARGGYVERGLKGEC